MPETAVSVLKSYYQRTKIHPIARDGRFSTKVVLPENGKSIRLLETAVSVLKSYYQRTKIHPIAGDGRFSTKVVLPENENSSDYPETAVQALKLFYQGTKIYCHPVAGDGRSSTKVVLPENEIHPVAGDGPGTKLVPPRREKRPTTTKALKTISRSQKFNVQGPHWEFRRYFRDRIKPFTMILDSKHRRAGFLHFLLSQYAMYAFMSKCASFENPWLASKQLNGMPEYIASRTCQR